MPEIQTEGFQSKQKPRLPLTISKDASGCIKGLAVLLMVLVHYYGNGVFTIQKQDIVNAIVCVAMFAFVSGYAHQLLTPANSLEYPAFLKRFFLSFYKQFLFTAIVVFATFHALELPIPTWEGFVENLLLLTPNKPFDSWWYAFCFAVLCLFVYPLLKMLEITTERYPVIFYSASVLFTLICFALPWLFTHFELSRPYTTMWGHTPVVRTVIFIPYYVLGYVFCKSVKCEKVINWGTLASILILAVCVFFPFKIYSIKMIFLIDVGKDFVIVMILCFVLMKFNEIRCILNQLGRISTFLWLVHIPLRTVLHRVGDVPPKNLLILSLIASIIVAAIFSKVYGSLTSLITPRNEGEERRAS